MAIIAPSAEFNFMKTKVIKPHHATDETQLELRFNDIVYVLEQDDSGWWGGHKEGEDCTGWFPGSCVREVLEEESPDLVSPAPSPDLVSYEPNCEPSPMAATDEVPEVDMAVGQIPKACMEDLDLLDEQDPLYHGNRMVASPNRRVSGGGNAAPSNDSGTALESLQAEYKNSLKINEEQALEIQHLKGKLADANEERAANAHWRTEELQRQCQSFKKEKEETEKQMQDLITQLEARSSASRLAERRADDLQTQLTKSQQETRDCMNECAQLGRRLHEKESELAKTLEKQSARTTQEPAREPLAKQLPQTSPLAKTPSADDARRRLFPSTADASIAGMAPTEKDLAHSLLDATAEEVSNVSATMETVPRLIGGLSAFRQPPQPPAGGRVAPALSAPPRSARSNSLTRPAFRPSPNASSSSMLLSPGGLAKCLSTGDLPPTPVRMDTGESEIPAVGCVKEITRLFEKRCASPAPSRAEGRRPTTDGDLSFRAHATPLGQRSPLTEQRPATEQRLRENHQPARSASRQPFKSSEASARVQQLPKLDMQEAEDAAEYQVNFNMSPMKRSLHT